MTNKKLWMSLLLAASLAVAGCGSDGSDGKDGAAGPAGPAGPAAPAGAALETCTVCHAETRIADVAEFHGLNGSDLIDLQVSNVSVADVGGFPVLSFHVEDADGNPITDLADYEGRLYLAELVPGAAGDADAWLRWSYERTDSSTDHDDDPATADIGPGSFDTTDAADGDYTYTFLTPFADAPDADNVQRVSFRVRILNVTTVPNTSFDFLIADPGTAVSSGKDTVTTNACNACHDPLALHGGGYNETTICVNCHNVNYSGMPANSLGTIEGDFGYMVHKIHAAQAFEALDDAISYEEVTYPQDLRNCTTCHKGPDANNWNMVPTMASCGSCHEISFVDPAPAGFTLHAGGAQTNNQNCTTCHTAVGIRDSHVTENATANNPDLLPGQRKIAYEVDGAVINASDELVITFRILSNGTALDLTALPADLATPGRWPGFLLAWAEAQDGIAAPADFTNTGNSAGQPTSISVDDFALACAAGTCTATVANPFPADATMRTIGLQGYFQQDIAGETVSLHTRSVVVTVTGDTPRRAVVDSAKCAGCHEIFEGHGGNRNLTADGGVEICILCHMVNLTSSGRAADPANLPQATIDALGTDPLTFPEATNNLKDMIHGIHSSHASVRTQIYEFVRNRSGGIYYDWSEVTYPAEPSNCNKCHLSDTYYPEAIPSGALMTTNVTTNGADPMTRDEVSASRDTVPNATDEVITATAAACYSCHTADTVVEHMILNGAGFGTRSEVLGQ
ncbi:MAG: OmcA/MtrC family decaheme c-type cytochrome [Deferrisomatales bacterium]|nr:OmcA/MtrC family decaheme c-type cytochrome [Deferrisomatales bacterium]